VFFGADVQVFYLGEQPADGLTKADRGRQLADIDDRIRKYRETGMFRVDGNDELVVEGGSEALAVVRSLRDDGRRSADQINDCAESGDLRRRGPVKDESTVVDPQPHSAVPVVEHIALSRQQGHVSEIGR
jgi:hypothetical protein